MLYINYITINLEVKIPSKFLWFRLKSVNSLESFSLNSLQPISNVFFKKCTFFHMFPLCNKAPPNLLCLKKINIYSFLGLWVDLVKWQFFASDVALRFNVEGLVQTNTCKVANLHMWNTGKDRRKAGLARMRGCMRLSLCDPKASLPVAVLMMSSSYMCNHLSLLIRKQGLCMVESGIQKA